MLKRLRSAAKWLLAIQNYRAGNNEKFLTIVESMDKSLISSAYQQSLIASSLLIVGRYSEAEEKFQSIDQDLANFEDQNSKYIRLYCRARINGMKGDLNAVSALSSQASSLNCKQLYRDQLPIN